MKGLFALILLFPVLLPAQTYLMNGTPITGCSGTFYDSGGAAGNYGNNQNLSTTICSDGTGGTHVRLSFSGTDLLAGDVLCFYDGPTAASLLLSCSSDYPAGQPFVVQATAANPSGCITVTFQSDGAGTATGWAAALSCVASCQTILADLVSTNPAIVPSDTGWIDICPGQRVFFTGAGIYPQNNIAYQQSDFTTSFEWNFGDGGIAYGPNTSHRFDQPGGYFVQLALTDTLGCRNSNLISQRIRVAPRPDFNLTTPAQICAGDTLNLNATVDTSVSGTTVSAFPITSSFDIEGSRADSLPLPDGTGELYETSILLTEFSPGQVLVDASDLEQICINIEHSWMRDIEITLTCPSGQTIILHDHPGNFGGQVFLGEPNDNDNFNPIPGIGYDYCWTPNAVNPTWITYANSTGVGTLPPGDYSTFDPISDLVGCPLNGEWTIGVTDYWAADNGYIFNWSILFQESLYPNIETFATQFVTWGWNNHPSVFFSNMDSLAAAPQNAGNAGYRFSVTDDFGCSWDTLVNVPVLPPTHPNCYTCATNFPVLQDATICAGEPAVFNATSLSPTTQEVRFETYPDYRLGNANHPHSNPYLSPVSVNSLGFNFLTNPIQQITSVCMDIETDFASDLNILLRAPGGQQLVLSTGNGGAGDNYKITCFSPSATLPIIGQAAPFNGTYIPEGNWNNLSGTPVTGNWSLVVSDGFAPAQFGKVVWWSIGFNTQNTVAYNWSNAATLSCNNCSIPTATPSNTTTYVLTATDTYNCIHTDTVVVNVNNFFPAPTGLSVFQLGANSMTWVWNAVPGALGYEVSVNGGPWEMPNSGTLSHTVFGVGVGQTVDISLRAISPSACVPEVENASSVFPDCIMFGDVFSTTDVLCAGDQTGSATLSVSNSTFPVQFFLDTISTPFPNGDLLNILGGGNHSVIILDALGCRDTVFFTINEPAPIVINTLGTNVLCNGDDSGQVSATAMGGTGGIAFSWRDCLGGPTLGGAVQNNLFAGCYAVTATDGNGCTSTQSVVLTEPPPYVFDLTQDSVSCNGSSDGSASISVSGGTPGYTYLWDNGQMTTTASNLDAGFHFVTVTDLNLCASTTLVEVLEPDVLGISNILAQNLNCFDGNNGSATVVAIGGTQPYTYLWDDPTGQITQQATSLTQGSYTVLVTDWNGCTAQSGVSLSAPPALQLTFANISNEICAGDCLGQVTAVGAGGVGGYQFDWQDSSLPDVALAINLCPGTYALTLTDANGCTVQNQANIAAAAPIVTQLQGTAPSCSGFQDGMINAIIAGGSTPYQFLWSNGGTSAALQNLPCGPIALMLTDGVGCVQNYAATLDCPETILVLGITVQDARCFGSSDGAITVEAQGGALPLNYLWNDAAAQNTQTAQNLPMGPYTVTITDANGCNISTTATVSQPSQLTVTTSHTDASCLNFSDGSATANPVGGTSPYSFSWGATGTNQTISNLTASTYFVTVTDANLCTATASATIAQPSTVVMVTATQTRFACAGESDGEASVSASGGNGATFMFQWSTGQVGGGASGLATGLYTVTATDPKGCTGTQMVAIQALDSIEVFTAYTPPTCADDADGLVVVVLIKGGLGMGDTTQYQYQWSLAGAPNSTVVNGFSGGKYFLTVTDLQGCTGSTEINIVAPAPVLVQLTSENLSCFGAFDGEVAVNSVQNAVGAVTYQWNNGETTAMIDNLPAGFYAVTVTDENTCTAVALAQLQQPEMLELTFQIQALVCAGDSNGAVSALVTGGTPGYDFQWSNGANTSNIANLGPGNYILQVIDSNGCLVQGSALVTQPDPIQLSTVLIEPTCFGGLNGRITLNVLGGQPPFRYSQNGGPLGGSNVFIALGAGTYNLLVQDANGCTASTLVSLGQPLPVEVLIGMDTTIGLGDSVLLSPVVNNAFGTTSFEWQTVLSDTFTCVGLPECEEIWASPEFSNTYRLKVTDANGCMGIAAVKIWVEKPRGVYVPTGFTPNADFSNDLLVVHGKEKMVRKVVNFKIFDRWGELVYQDQDFTVNDSTRGWDGTFRGQECDPSVFVWVLEVEYQDGYIELLKGNVTLIR